VSAIVFDGIEQRYGDLFAVRDFSVAVEQGEFMTILGPSGSGKTTLLSLVAGLLLPSAGRIWIGGRDVTRLTPQQRKVGLVFQSYALFPHLNVFRNVAFPLAVRGTPKEEIAAKVAAALALVRLAGMDLRRPAQLSGGQQQRVALARAIVFQPDILLLDEPLGALDRKLREELQVELKSMQRGLGITTLLVTHDQEEALSLSDRILVLDRGRVQQVATPAEAYRRPANAFVANFLGHANSLGGVVAPGGLRLNDGQTVPCATLGYEEGQRVTAVVRPERVSVQPGDGGEGMAATLRQIVYLGHLQRWHLGAADGRAIVANLPDGTPALAPGAPVRVTWSPEDAWPLPDLASPDHRSIK
jgi:putative spermidine/putrescine transport system ATP-binding protein